MLDYIRKMYLATFGEELLMSDDEINQALANHETIGPLWTDPTVTKNMVVMAQMTDILERLYNIQRQQQPMSLVSELPTYTVRANGHKFEITQPAQGRYALLVDDVGMVASPNSSDCLDYMKKNYGIEAIDTLFDCYFFVFGENLKFSKEEVFYILSKAKGYGDHINDREPRYSRDFYIIQNVTDLTTYLRGFERHGDKIIRVVTGEVV